MVIEIMNRKEALDFSYNTEDWMPTGIISITDTDKPDVVFGRFANIHGILRLKFDDVQGDEPNAMTVEDALNILEFVSVAQMDPVLRLIVHCEGGVSRSAGIAAAIKTILKQDDMDIFRNPKYAPNKHCYYTLLNTYFGSFPEQEHKFVENIEAYRKAEGLDDEQ